VRPALPILLTGLALALGACGSSDETAVAPPPQTTQETTPPTSAAPTSPASSAADAPECKQVDNPGEKSADVATPEGALPTDKRTIVDLKTSCGTIVIELDATAHPVTANGFASLVRDGYYDKTIFHRVVPGFVIQGGDPLGNGTGGPKWRLTEAPGADAQYPVGTVAMAKTATEAAGTFSSQFFIVTGTSSALTPDYAIAGKVVKGQDVAQKIESMATTADGPPSQTIVLEKATLREK
jgi:cyclophilin family peptidyl-prolyl cis-trans isomerase